MAFEAALFKRTRLGEHTNCLALMEAYAGAAPLWERFCMASYVSIGPFVARLLGADTASMWSKADSIIADVFAVSRLSPLELVRELRRYIRLNLEKKEHLSFEEAREEIYEQSFYPLVTHFTFALQPSAVARLKFIREAVAAITEERGSFADLGCGSGVILCDVLKHKPRWTGNALDISPAAINYAERLSRYKLVNTRAEFRVGDMAQLPYADETLDLVISSEVIEHAPDPQRVICEIARVLRPEGKLILTIPMESHAVAHLNSPGEPEDLRALCERAGLSVRRLETHWHFGFGDDRKHIFAVGEKAEVRG
jgi:2-polyprenyl-3-methyl-5-hydroxy-6-metoxy-1,4-benzoquinol methylase